MYLSSFYYIIKLSDKFEAIPYNWQQLLQPFIVSHAYKKLCAYINQQIERKITVYPEQVFYALHLTDVCDVKVIILGQDPYHGIDAIVGTKAQAQAHGLAFSVPDGVRYPPSLRNIFKELYADIGYRAPPYKMEKEPISTTNCLQNHQHGCLTAWARQGVLLLNTVLTVAIGKPASHANLFAKTGQSQLGLWELCTDILLKNLADFHQQHSRQLIVMLWGRRAQTKAHIFTKNHIVLEAAHPSPFSATRGFFGCKHFSLANQALNASRQTAIDWSVNLFKNA